MADDPAAVPAPPPVPGDSRDWTWVNERACAECEFDAGATDPTTVAALIRANVEGWRVVLAGDEAAVRRRPAPEVWSPLEYGCHVRDVFRLYLERLTLMLTEDGPRYPDWDQDETAVEQRYDLADPSTVSAELASAGHRLADAFAAIEGDQWSRTGFRSDGASFTVATFATYLAHDPIHHLWDVRPA